MVEELRLESNSAEKLIEKYNGMVYRLALSHIGNKTDAEDVMQEVFMRFVRRKPHFNDHEHEKAWFLRTTINAAKSFRSSLWRRNAVLMPASEINAKSTDDYSDFTKISCAVFKLDSKKRTCIHLFYYEDFSVAKIAEITGFNESTVRSHLKRAREKLKQMLGDEVFRDEE